MARITRDFDTEWGANMVVLYSRYELQEML